MEWGRVVRLIPHATVLLLVPMYFWPWSPSAASSLFQIVLWASFFNFAAGFLSNCGLPRMQKSWFQNVAVDDHSHYMFFIAIFLGSYPIFFVMFPLFTASLYHTIPHIYEASRHPSCSRHPASTYIQDFCAMIMELLGTFKTYVAWTELLVILVLILNLVDPYRNPMQLVLYCQFLRLRYSVSPSTQNAIQRVVRGVDTVLQHESCPKQLQGLYLYIKNKIDASIYGLGERQNLKRE
eukprot:TRINITY_DN13219_c0_g1_i1.p1 TRINITY_DN13219_c0_g1~~TRINITY_DN13219_c0_g1_i1.p1  ORF type:complete len:237 (+),score=29.05 TRINITY_DN13219_c0_g1_i1:58-768(+)